MDKWVCPECGYKAKEDPSDFQKWVTSSCQIYKIRKQVMESHDKFHALWERDKPLDTFNNNEYFNNLENQ